MFRRNYCPAPKNAETPEAEMPESESPEAETLESEMPEAESVLEPDAVLEPDPALEADATPKAETAQSHPGTEIGAKFVNPLRPSETSSTAPDRSPLETPEPAAMPAPAEPPVFPEAAQPPAAPVAAEPPASPSTIDTSPAPQPELPPEPADRHSGHVLVGEGVKFVGQIRECRQIEIFGAVDGDLEVEELIVHENGLLKGNVKADRAEVWGALDGEVSVKELLDVKSGGSVSGKTEYGALSIATGGRVVGTLDDGSNKITKPASVSTFTPGTVTDRLTTEA